MLTDKETATILFALRYFQQEMGDEHEDNLIDPNGYFADHTPLASEEIDSLCDRMNSPEWLKKLVDAAEWMDRCDDTMQLDAEQRAGCRSALQAVTEIIQCTYAYDDDGNRIEGEGKCSGADIVEMLCDIEDGVAKTLASLG